MANMNTDIIKRCPFCGGELELHCTGRYYMHKLNGCILQHFCFETDDEERIKKWNTRKPMQNIVERLEELAHDNPMVTDNYILRREAIEIVKEEGLK